METCGAYKTKLRRSGSAAVRSRCYGRSLDFLVLFMLCIWDVLVWFRVQDAEVGALPGITQSHSFTQGLGLRVQEVLNAAGISATKGSFKDKGRKLVQFFIATQSATAQKLDVSSNKLDRHPEASAPLGIEELLVLGIRASRTRFIRDFCFRVLS